MIAIVTSRSSNRGPAAAAGNRQALLREARRLLSEHGFDVPLSTIAKAAGVSQGVLYRHFPHRVDLAFAVFEENFTVLETLAADTGPDAFDQLFDRLVELTVESLGFIELVLGAKGAREHYDGPGRLEDLVSTVLPRARDAGRIAADVTAADVELGLRMIYGVAVTATGGVVRHEAVLRVREVLSTHWRRRQPMAGPVPSVLPSG